MTRRRGTRIRACGRRSGTKSSGRRWRDSRRSQLRQSQSERLRGLFPSLSIARTVRASVKTYTPPVYPYTKPRDLTGVGRRWPVIVAGAGPVGLVAAIDLAQHGIDVLLLDDDDTVSSGSRAICWSKRTLEILDRLGCGEPLVAKGVSWNVGRVYFGSAQLFQFDL